MKHLTELYYLVCAHTSTVCIYVEATGQHQVPSSATFYLLYLRQSLWSLLILQEQLDSRL